jgi:CRP-like cAMP-binding protein
MIIVIEMDKTKTSIENLLAVAGQTLDVEPGAVLFRQGERPRMMYWVLAGELRLVRHTPAGEAVILQRCHAGPFAEGSLFSSSYHCDGVAAQPSRVLRVSRVDFQGLLAEPDFGQSYVMYLSREVRQLRSRCERLSLPRAEDRILHALADCGAYRFGPGHGTLKDWAEQLGMTHETLYRTLAALEKKGVVGRHGDSITLTA